MEKIRDRNAHLNWYKIDQEAAEPPRTIRYKSQFGQHSVRIHEPKSLLVPAQRTSDPDSAFPESLDHNKCYSVVDVPVAPNLPVVTLEDQFGTEQGLQVGPPRFFRVPVSKQIPGAEPGPRGVSAGLPGRAYGEAGRRACDSVGSGRPGPPAERKASRASLGG